MTESDVPPNAGARDERLRLAWLASGLASWEVDVQRDVVYWDDATRQLFEVTAGAEPQGTDAWFALGVVHRDPAGRAVRMPGVCRHVTSRKSAEVVEHRQIAAFGSAVGVALTSSQTIPSMLAQCAEAMVEHLGAALARIWTLGADGTILELQASAGMYTHLDGPHGRIHVGAFKIGLIASERTPHLTNDLQHDPRCSDPAWVRREQMVSFAGHPLLVDGRLDAWRITTARLRLMQKHADAELSPAERNVMAEDPRVLIVDDEPQIRALLTRWLTRWGYAVTDAGSATEALDLMAAQPVDVVVCDIGMPDRDGLWLAEQVHERWPTTAIIMGTGVDESIIVRTSRKVGAVAYVTKPFDADLLRQAVDHAAGRLHFRSSAEPGTGA